MRESDPFRVELVIQWVLQQVGHFRGVQVGILHQSAREVGRTVERTEYAPKLRVERVLGQLSQIVPLFVPFRQQSFRLQRLDVLMDG